MGHDPEKDTGTCTILYPLSEVLLRLHLHGFKILSLEHTGTWSKRMAHELLLCLENVSPRCANVSMCHRRSKWSSWRSRVWMNSPMDLWKLTQEVTCYHVSSWLVTTGADLVKGHSGFCNIWIVCLHESIRSKALNISAYGVIFAWSLKVLRSFDHFTPLAWPFNVPFCYVPSFHLLHTQCVGKNRSTLRR